MSFLVDPPLLIGTGATIATVAPDEKTARRLEGAVLVVFLVTSISLYFNARWTDWLARLCRAETGRDWMLNSGVFHFDHAKPKPKVHAVSALIFATYPAWLRLGRKLGSR